MSLVIALLVAALVQAAAPTTPHQVTTSGQSKVGYFEAHEDVGKPAIAGTTVYDPKAQTYTITGAGVNMWGVRDEFQFAWRKLSGDFIVTTQASFLGKGVNAHRKLGWLVRKSLDADSPYVDAAVHGDGLTSLQFRRTAGGNTEETRAAMTHADVIQLERTGGKFIMSVAKFGEPFTRVELADVDLGDEVYVGLFVCSHDPKVSEKAVFRNVRVVIPPKTGWTPYRDYIGSNLELMDIATGNRTVIHTETGSIQAPNWTTDNKALIYNGGGRLYRFDLKARKPTVIDTGFATRNNNDHVLSFDGKLLGISHNNPEDKNRSVVYTVPIKGGTPKRVTPLAPSYFHGFSPDAKFMLYTGIRETGPDIYKIPVTGGDEVRLTTAEGLDDGSEYTPDGKWIYFNSSRTGRMQIWRMRPDGSEQEQITKDESFNDWFPHVSPDGKSIVFISYGLDVKAEDHPWYKHVYLRTMNLDGSNLRVVAYLFGGQGSINVPSWSPDSKRIAFVSNSALTAPH